MNAKTHWLTLLITFKLLNMNLKTLLSLSILFILTSQKIVYGQESDTLTRDTICIDVKTVEHLAKSTEKYYICQTLNEANEEEIRLLREVIDEKQVQDNLNQGLLHGFRAEIKKLRRHRTFLTIGIGGALAFIIVQAL